MPAKPNDPVELTKRLTIIWAAQLAFPLAAGVVLATALDRSELGPIPPIFVWILMALAVLDLPLAFFISNTVYRRAELPAAQRIQTAAILRLALLEGSVLMLLIGYFVAGDVVAIAVAAVPYGLMLAQKPSLDDIRQRVRVLEQGKG